ncbi:hypothetical protein RJ640_007521 [Escallonia rubra]|uniref:Aquaporin n=1 Tax=Escallonia rubra TaxID=112253 RepID=A0AA88S447_9ASTE|nr:hypothetical protein RJ640_007521 [Escallonia rubra]
MLTESNLSSAALICFSGTCLCHAQIIAELLGTFVIIFMGCGSVVIDRKFRLTSVGIAMTWGLAVMVMIYTFGHVSGGHFNPAVTIAFAASRKFPWRQVNYSDSARFMKIRMAVPAFVASQLAGSTLAVGTLSVIFHQRVDIRCTTTQYISPTTHLEALAWEFIISFILMLTICGVATDSRAINELSGVTVGATVLINVVIAGKITGASMNPARSIGPAIVSGEFHHLWVYIVAPVLGTMTACVIYSLLRLPINDNHNLSTNTS